MIIYYLIFLLLKNTVLLKFIYLIAEIFVDNQGKRLLPFRWNPSQEVTAGMLDMRAHASSCVVTDSYRRSLDNGMDINFVILCPH